MREERGNSSAAVWDHPLFGLGRFPILPLVFFASPKFLVLPLILSVSRICVGVKVGVHVDSCTVPDLTGSPGVYVILLVVCTYNLYFYLHISLRSPFLPTIPHF